VARRVPYTRAVILRIVLGHFAGGDDVEGLVELRDRLTRTARAVDGLESLILGSRRHAPDGATGGDGTEAIQAAIVTVWRDAETMARATSVDEQERFLATRLQLDFQVERTDHFEIVGRTFAALPPDRPALVRILTVTAGPNDEAALVGTLRAQQPRLVEHGLVASHLGRRFTDGGAVEAVHVSVWLDREALVAATGGIPERPFYAAELQPWRDRITLELFDGIEVAPLLPVPSGAPLVILDDQTRIVDLTTAAAAVLGMPPEDLVGATMAELAAPVPGLETLDWAELERRGELAGQLALAVPAIGEILVRVIARRDVPVAGRHAVLVRRHRDPAPTPDELAISLAEAFPKA
jgi:PAS domain-containing protein